MVFNSNSVLVDAGSVSIPTEELTRVGSSPDLVTRVSARSGGRRPVRPAVPSPSLGSGSIRRSQTPTRGVLWTFDPAPRKEDFHPRGTRHKPPFKSTRLTRLDAHQVQKRLPERGPKEVSVRENPVTRRELIRSLRGPPEDFVSGPGIVPPGFRPEPTPGSWT